ncbi:hypothetical protein BDZ88DRAFT_432534 [Geranomyces variabilis]|nr:hypothetical protein BDZ88DRAFT_432534 [Geranomyces variabilis]
MSHFCFLSAHSTPRVASAIHIVLFIFILFFIIIITFFFFFVFIWTNRWTWQTTGRPILAISCALLGVAAFL